ncbi:MAG: ATP-dependent Clp protease adaptor ClpS [Candidatus Hydrogenedentes bacterium]|nr:ATP-dependent Clp protease adaptor ClpS [Candidatus Hydrogenedentota bacterium]
MAEYISKPGQKTAIRDQVDLPRRYKVLLHNDNYTTMEFVVMVLRDVFRKPADEAIRIMLSVHENGMGVAGVYVKAIAETKVDAVHKRAQEHGYPLRCSLEPE